MTGPVKALRDLADEQDAEAQRCEDHAKHHRQQAQYFANLAQQAATNAEAYREAANTLATLHSAGATLEGTTCPSDCAARHPGREHEWITTHLPHNDDV